VEARWELTTWESGELTPVRLGEISLTEEGIKMTDHENETMLTTFRERNELDFKVC